MKEKIVVMGGSFNPITCGHLSLAQQMVDLYKLDFLLFLPVGDLYKKNGLISAKHRFKMLDLITMNNPQLKVSRVEKDSLVNLNTVDSLRIIQNQYPEKEVCFLMGTDNLRDLVRWDKKEELMNEFKIFVIQRGEKVEDILNEIPELKSFESTFIPVQGILEHAASSTSIRDLIRRGISPRYLIPDEAHFYIHVHKLYRE